MEVIAVINQKGGTGKTTTAHAIGTGLYLKGKALLFVDLDSQCNLTYTTGAQSSTTIADLLQAAVDNKLTPGTVEAAIRHTAQGDIITSSPNIAAADTVLSDVTGREYKLREILEPIRAKYDYIIIDTPPTLGTLTINALTAADSVIAPAQAEIYSVIATQQLHSTVETVKKYCNPNLSFKGIVLTRYNGRAVISREIADKIAAAAQTYGTRLFKTRIRECTALKESETMQQSIFTYAPRSNAAKDYGALIEELIN